MCSSKTAPFAPTAAQPAEGANQEHFFRFLLVLLILSFVCFILLFSGDLRLQKDSLHSQAQLYALVTCLLYMLYIQYGLSSRWMA